MTVEPSMKRVAVLPWPGIKGAYLCVSGKVRTPERVGDKWYAKNGGHREHTNTYGDRELHTEPCITFTYEEDGIAAEWDGAHGPIQLWWKSHEGYKEGYDESHPHWLWPWAIGRGHWSQMAVRDECLPERFSTGDYDAIFSTLRGWVRSRLEERNLEGDGSATADPRFYINFEIRGPDPDPSSKHEWPPRICQSIVGQVREEGDRRDFAFIAAAANTFDELLRLARIGAQAEAGSKQETPPEDV